MKKLNWLFTILFMGTIFSCENDIAENVSNNTLDIQNKDFKIHKLETEYDFNSFSEEDQLKLAIGESLENLLISDKEYARDFLQKLVDNNKTKEFLYAEKKGVLANRTIHSSNTSKKTLESLLIENVNNSSIFSKGNSAEREKRVSLIQRAESILPNLVIKIPDWANIVITNIGLEKLDYAVYSGINTKDLSFKYKRNGKKPSNLAFVDYIPIQVKESEKLIPLKKGTNKTIWEDDLIDNHFPSLKTCDNFIRDNYITYKNANYDFIDRMRLNEDLVKARLCGINLNGGTETSPCTKIYQRDCVTEKNVIEGFKMTNNSVFRGINNQPGGEDVISLHYVFVASQMCGDTTVPKDCPPTTWKFIFFGSLLDFFEIQTHYGNPTASELNDIIYRGNGFYVKSFPKYYDIPVNLSFEGIYSQAPYLINTQNSSWDGNIYGSVVSFSVYEHDDVIVKETQSQSIKVTNTTKVSTKLSLGKTFEGGADFSNTVTRTSSYTYNIEASKDVALGQNASVYFDQNYQTSALYGINKSTGAITTHFAFYH